MNEKEIIIEIKNKLCEIEQKENVRIIHCIESGSRSWGFASPDSDFDARFIYVRPTEYYLKLEKTRDVIEWELNDVYDINGWDIKKALELLHKFTSTLLENVQKLSNVTIMENTIMCGVKQTNTGYSAFLKLPDDSYETCNCHFMILATGGIGRVYQFTTNSAIATGDGITFAYEMGAKIKNLSYVQFHPTAFNNRATRECFLISEAVRGEGAYLLNCKKERFMHNYDERLELAPRDVVSHAIVLESRKQNSTDFYLDISYKDSEFLKKRFPMIYKNLLEQGYDLTKEPVPIFPCQHYLMGGIDVDNNSETNLPNLYACGECSHTGVHGSNRLASNSLLEALVFSRHAANNIASKLSDAPKDFEEAQFDAHLGSPKIPKGVRTETRKILQNCYFVIPDKKAAADGFKRVKEIRDDLINGGYLVDADFVLAKSIVTVAYIILGEVMQ